MSICFQCFGGRVGKKVLISVYTTCKNAIEDEFTLFEGLYQALKFCDEFIYVDGGSTDGTYEYMKRIAEKDSRVKVFQEPDPADNIHLYTEVKNRALSKCSGTWKFLMDADEVYTDKLVDFLRKSKNRDFLEKAASCKWFIKIPVFHIYGSPDIVAIRDPVKGHTYYTKRIYGITKGLHQKVNTDPDLFVLDRVPLESFKHRGLYLDLMENAAVIHYGHLRSNETYLRRKNLIERRFDSHWKDLSEWSFEEMCENWWIKPCFESSFAFEKMGLKHPDIMFDRLNLTTHRGFVNRELFEDFYEDWIKRTYGL